MQPRESYSNTAGLKLLSQLPEAGVFRTHDALTLGKQLHISEHHVQQLLSELSKADWIRRLQRGLYAPVDRATNTPRAHPFTIGTSLVEPAAVSHWSALSHWELTEQIPQFVTVSSPTRSAARGLRRQSRAEDSSHWLVGSQKYRVVFIRRQDFFGSNRIWISQSERVPIFDPERALLDTFRHFHVFGSLTPAIEILEQHKSQLDFERLVDYAARLGVASAMRRIGWVMDRVDAPRKSRARLLEIVRARSGHSVLDPTRPENGSRNDTWSVLENLDGR